MYLDLIVNEKSRKVFEERARIIEYIRNYFKSQDFMEVEKTPMMQVLPESEQLPPCYPSQCPWYGPIPENLNLCFYLGKGFIVGGLERVFEINRNLK